MMQRLLGLWMFFWASHIMAEPQPPRTGILPDDPISNTDISIGIASALSPCIGTGDMYPTFYHLSDSNHITFVIAAQVVNPCPNVPGFSISYEIGTLEEGSYTMQVYIVNSPNDVPTTINDPLGAMWGDDVSFFVEGIGNAIAIPTIGVIGLISLISIFLAIVYFQMYDSFVTNNFRNDS